jgi:hypothetical protein
MSSPKRITNWWAVLAIGLFTGMIRVADTDCPSVADETEMS